LVCKPTARPGRLATGRLRVRLPLPSAVNFHGLCWALHRCCSPNNPCLGQLAGELVFLRDEEANASAASLADKSLAKPLSAVARRRRVAAVRASVGAIDDEGRGEEPSDRL